MEKGKARTPETYHVLEVVHIRKFGFRDPLYHSVSYSGEFYFYSSGEFEVLGGISMLYEVSEDQQKLSRVDLHDCPI